MDALFVQPTLSYPNTPIAGRHQSVRQAERYIEIGLLAIASYFRGHGASVAIVDLCDSRFTLEDLAELVRRARPRLVAIPNMSGYSYPGLRECSRIVKESCPRSFVITGGQHAAPLGRLVLEEIPEVDCVVPYEGELASWQIFDAIGHNDRALERIPGLVVRSGSNIATTAGHPERPPLNEMPFLDYTLFPDFTKFVPRLEESRGCPYDCSFCSNASVFGHSVRYKTAARLIDELCAIHAQYGEPAALPFYMISKNYGLNKEVTVEFAERARQLPFRAEWRTQSTVDVFDPELLPVLARSGLRMIDLGLESASPTMLRLMNKTAAKPTEYLRKIEAIIEALSRYPQIKLKLNLIFHPGETPETVSETLEFLYRWRSKIAAVTAAPVMIDPGSPLWHETQRFEQEFGTRLIKNAFWDSIHIYPADPSRAMTFEQANFMSSLISKTFQTKDAYFTTRKFGGLPLDYDLAKFEQQMESIPDHLRPYVTEPDPIAPRPLPAGEG